MWKWNGIWSTLYGNGPLTGRKKGPRHNQRSESTIPSFLPKKRKLHEAVGTDIAAESAMSGRRKRLATRPTQSSQDDTGTDIEMLDETTVAGGMRTSSRTRRPSQKARDNGSAGAADIAAILETMQKHMEQSQRQMQQFMEANTQLRNENKELKDMITSLKLDIESMKAYSPYWGQSFASQSPPQSYANVAGTGSNNTGSARGSPKQSRHWTYWTSSTAVRTTISSERVGPVPSPRFNWS